MMQVFSVWKCQTKSLWIESSWMFFCPSAAADEEEQDAQRWLAWLPADVGVESSSSLCLCLPPSLKIHYTPANGVLMRTSLVDRPSCVAQGRLIAAWFPNRAVWQDGLEKSRRSRFTQSFLLNHGALACGAPSEYRCLKRCEWWCSLEGETLTLDPGFHL